MAKASSKKAEVWRQHIASYQESGLSRKAFCRKHRLNIHTLDYWRKRLDRATSVSNPKNKNGFIQVQVKEETLTDSCIKLHVGQVSVEVPEGFDPAHLKNILRVLGATC